MKDVWLFLIHLPAVAAKLLGPGGVKGIIAENLLIKQQLLVAVTGSVPSPADSGASN